MTDVEVAASCAFELFVELSTSPQIGALPVHRESAQKDLADLVEEAFVSGVMAEELPADVGRLDVEVTPVWDRAPRAEAIEVTLTERDAGRRTVKRRFRSGRWMRRAHERTWQLAADGVLEEDARIYVHLLAEEREPEALTLPTLQAPVITAQAMSELGVRALGAGELCPDRPVLVNERLVDEIVLQTERAGALETGGGTIGKMIRLEQPLPGTSTRVVTILSAAVVDPRHVGTVARVTFDPVALTEAAQVATLRGRGETVLTAFHTHGWGTACGRCNQNEECVLPSASHVSLDDYRVLETLFPSKATLMPIAGRKLGAPTSRPVLEIHAWRGGRMAAIPWRSYRD